MKSSCSAYGNTHIFTKTLFSSLSIWLLSTKNTLQLCQNSLWFRNLYEISIFNSCSIIRVYLQWRASKCLTEDKLSSIVDTKISAPAWASITMNPDSKVHGAHMGPQVAPILAPWTLLSGKCIQLYCLIVSRCTCTDFELVLSSQILKIVSKFAEHLLRTVFFKYICI